MEEIGLNLDEETYEDWLGTLSNADFKDLRFLYNTVWLPKTREKLKQNTKSLIHEPSEQKFESRIKLYKRSKKDYAERITELRETLIRLHKL